MFEEYPKIKRIGAADMTITEKIDGTNAQVVIKDNEIILVGSRKREIRVGDDNFVFAAWVQDNCEGLIEFLGEGTHYGEWAGPGIQKNPLYLEKKMFFLFNTHRNPQEKFEAIGDLVPDLRGVPVIHTGHFNLYDINKTLRSLMEGGSYVEEARVHARPEGIVISVFGTKFKRTPSDLHKGEKE